MVPQHLGILMKRKKLTSHHRQESTQNIKPKTIHFYKKTQEKNLGDLGLDEDFLEQIQKHKT